MNGFVNFTTKDGLADNRVSAIHQNPNGVMWFATGHLYIGGGGGGVSRYDRKEFVNLTTTDGLADNQVRAIHRDPNGKLWFGTYGGVSRYDGKEFVNFTTTDGLVHNTVLAIHHDLDGAMWFGTFGGGVSRYDGKQFVNFTTEDGLADNRVLDLYRDPNGELWFGTYGGVSRYNGKGFINFTQKDGLANDWIYTIYRDSDGIMWFGTYGSGVSQYDGIAWTSLDTRDGLAGNTVRSIHQDSDGYLWFGTEEGITRYRRSTVPPKVHIVSVTTDQIYRDLSGIPAFTIGTRVTIKYSALDFKTVPEKQQYRIRINEVEVRHASPPQWRKPTRAVFFDYTFDKPGEYIFQVQAIDRDLNYSEPASVTLKVVPPFYMTAGFLLPTVGLGTILLLVSIVSATAYFKHRRRVRAYERAAAEELQDAREMQMSLMPQTAPPIEGIEIAGRCVSANTVGGDFFDYLQSERPNEIGLVVADVTGKGLKGAMNAVMTDGILRTTVMEQEQFSPASLLMTVNNVLKDSMEQYMNVTMVIGVLDVETKTLTFANAAHHAHPLLLRLGLSRQEPTHAFGLANEVTYRNQGEVQKLESGGLPLGMRAGVQYTEEQFELQSGDVLILMTDGIIEALDNEEHYYSDSGRLEETIRKFTQDISAEAMVDAIIGDAIAFGNGKASRDDDMTVVVAKIQ